MTLKLLTWHLTRQEQFYPFVFVFIEIAIVDYATICEHNRTVRITAKNDFDQCTSLCY